jgi:hypothetical protein
MPDRLLVLTVVDDVQEFVPVHRRMIEALGAPPENVLLANTTSTAGATSPTAARNDLIDHAVTLNSWTWGLLLDARTYLSPAALDALRVTRCDVIAPLVTHGAVPGHDVSGTADIRAARTVGAIVLVHRAVFDRGCRFVSSDGNGSDSTALSADTLDQRCGLYVHHGVFAHACAIPEEMALFVEADNRQHLTFSI